MAERSKSGARANRARILAGLLAVSCLLLPLDSPAGAQSTIWRDASQRAVLKNRALEASFQAGRICSLKDRATGKALVSIDPGTLPSQLAVFDVTPIDLDSSTVVTKASSSSTVTTYRLRNGSEWRWDWSIEKGDGDLILQTSALAPGSRKGRLLLQACICRSREVDDACAGRL